MEKSEKIILESGKLFTKYGFKAITMDSIAQSLGISKRIIYENFSDKDELIKKVLIYYAKLHKKQLLEILEHADNVYDAIFRFGEFNHRIMAGIAPVFFEDLNNYHTEQLQDILESGDLRNYEIPLLLLKKGIEEGMFIDTLDVEIANLFIHHTMNLFFRLDNKEAYSHKKVMGTVFGPYLRGISTEKGLKLFDNYLEKMRLYKR